MDSDEERVGKVRSLVEKHGLDAEIVWHRGDPVLSLEDAMRVHGLSPGNVLKCLLMKGRGGRVVAVMAQQGKIIKTVLKKVQTTLDEEYHYPSDIINALQQDPETWNNFNNFTEPYKRIRVAYVDNARKRPEVFQKRLKNLVKKTKNNMKFGYGINRFY